MNFESVLIGPQRDCICMASACSIYGISVLLVCFLAHLHGMVFSYDDSEIPLGAIGAWLMCMGLSSNSHEKAVSLICSRNR
jgi:hypothetical protein